MSGVQKLKSKTSKVPESHIEVADSTTVKRKRLANKRKAREEAYKKRIDKELKKTLREKGKRRASVSEEKTEVPKRSTTILQRGTVREGSEKTKRPGGRLKGFQAPTRARTVMVPPTRFPATRPITIPYGVPPPKPGVKGERILVSGGEGLGNIIMLTPLVNALVLSGFLVDVILFPLPENMEIKSLFRGYSVRVRHIVNGWDESECDEIKNINYKYTLVSRWGQGWKHDRFLPWFKNVRTYTKPFNTKKLWGTSEIRFNLELYERYIDPKWEDKILPLPFVACEQEEEYKIKPHSVGMHIGCKVGSIDWRRWKQWPYFHLLSSAFKNVVLFGTDEDLENYHDHVQDASWGDSVQSLIGETKSVISLASHIAKCSIFITNDSGVAHVAAATGVPTFTIMGGTSVDKLKGSGMRIITKNMTCQPCFLSKTCPVYPSACLQDLYPADVINHIEADCEVKHFWNDLIVKKGAPLAIPRKAKKKPVVTVVIPVKNRDPVSVRNLLVSLTNQSYKGGMEITLVDGGSSLPFRSRYKILARNFKINYKFINLSHWNKPLVLNYGIRNSSPSSKYILAIDCDMILGPNVIEAVVKTLSVKTDRFVVVRTKKLQRGALEPEDDITNQKVFEEMTKNALLTSLSACGGLQAAKRSWFFKMRGYDEDLFLWGAPDTDMLHRAQNSGKAEVIYLSLIHDWEVDYWNQHKSNTKVVENNEAHLFHQWHIEKNMTDKFIESNWTWNAGEYKQRLKRGEWTRNSPYHWGRIEGRKIIITSTRRNHLQWEFED